MEEVKAKDEFRRKLIEKAGQLNLRIGTNRNNNNTLDGGADG